MKYESIKVSSREEIEAAISKDDPNELWHAALSPALCSDDPDWAEGVCARLSHRHRFNVRRNAILGFGHIARIHKNVFSRDASASCFWH